MNLIIQIFTLKKKKHTVILKKICGRKAEAFMYWHIFVYFIYFRTELSFKHFYAMNEIRFSRNETSHWKHSIEVTWPLSANQKTVVSRHHEISTGICLCHPNVLLIHCIYLGFGWVIGTSFLVKNIMSHNADTLSTCKQNIFHIQTPLNTMR